MRSYGRQEDGKRDRGEGSMSEQELDTELIECEICKKVLNGKSLWVVLDDDETEPKTICEDCQQLRRIKNEKPN